MLRTGDFINYSVSIKEKKWNRRGKTGQGRDIELFVEKFMNIIYQSYFTNVMISLLT